MTTGSGSPTEQVSDWLSHFGTAMSQQDWSAVAALFGDECYWRDLVSFTWNITTLEGRSDIKSGLAATVSGVQPSHWQITGEADEETDGTIAAWFTFETAVAWGKGYVSLRDNRCWTLQTEMTELKGFEETHRKNRDFGVQHGVVKASQT